MTSALLIAFLMGVTGSLHCAGMCGAIMWAMPFYAFKGARKLVAFGMYHFMRISAYAGMGLILYSFRELFHPGIQQAVSVILGIILLLAGILSFLPGRFTSGVSLPWSGFVQKQLALFVGNPNLGKIAISGFLNGMLPCGLVYMALTGSLSSGSPAQVVAFIFAFGAGTLPMLASIVFLRSRLSLRSATVRKLVPVTIFCFGLLFVIRGLNLGIPYLSPSVEASNGKIVHSCCHKK